MMRWQTLSLSPLAVQDFQKPRCTRGRCRHHDPLTGGCTVCHACTKINLIVNICFRVLGFNVRIVFITQGCCMMYTGRWRHQGPRTGGCTVCHACTRSTSIGVRFLGSSVRVQGKDIYLKVQGCYMMYIDRWVHRRSFNVVVGAALHTLSDLAAFESSVKKSGRHAFNMLKKGSVYMALVILSLTRFLINPTARMLERLSQHSTWTRDALQKSRRGACTCCELPQS